MNRLDPFYPVLPDAVWVRRVLAAGARLVQLRAKHADQDRLRGEIADALAACRAYGAQLVVNDHWRLAIDLDADYVHLGQEDLLDADLSALRRHGIRFGLSTHDRAELETALVCRPNYVALGPIWPTQLKVMPWAPQGLARIDEWKRAIGALPLVAIGGLTPARATACLVAGADVVAVVGDIVRHADPEASIRAWLDATRCPA